MGPEPNSPRRVYLPLSDNYYIYSYYINHKQLTINNLTRLGLSFFIPFLNNALSIYCIVLLTSVSNVESYSKAFTLISKFRGQ
jgi:hypothetical protein